MPNTALWKQFEGQWVDNSYRLGRLLGAGGFGGVFLADHIIQGKHLRQVAIKLIFPDPQHSKQQLRELIAATTLRHPHLLECFHAGIATLTNVEVLFMVMEVAQETLHQRLKRGLLPAEEAGVVIAQIASALAWLHTDRRVHRDVKPANVLRVRAAVCSRLRCAQKSFSPG